MGVNYINDNDIDENNNEKMKQNMVKELVFPVNHLLHTMWKQVEVFAGGKLISNGSSNYHYKSLLKILLHNCKDNGEKKKMCTELFYEDKAGEHDQLSYITINPGGY